MYGDGALDLQRRSVTIRGVRLWYWRTGHGARDGLVVLHGLGGDHSGLGDMAGLLRGVDLILPDLPGYGDTAPLSQPHTLVNYADTIEDFRIALGLRRFHLLGHSLGASIALLYAARHPVALRSLCLLNPVTAAHGLTAALGQAYFRIAARLPARLASLWMASKPAVYVTDAAILTTWDWQVRRRILRQDYVNYRKASVRAMIESFLSYYQTDFDALAGAISCPTLLVTGSRDGLAPPSAIERLSEMIRSGPARIVPGGGHLLPVERPGETAELVNDFLPISSDQLARGWAQATVEPRTIAEQ